MMDKGIGRWTMKSMYEQTKNGWKKTGWMDKGIIDVWIND